MRVVQLDEIDPWRIRREIVWLHFLRNLATDRKDPSFRLGTHIALYDRYWRLASWHRRHGHARRSQSLLDKAIGYWNTSGAQPPHPPPSSPPAVQNPLAWFLSDAVTAYGSFEQRHAP